MPHRTELIQIIREDLLDDVTDNPDQDDKDYRWSQAFLTRGIATAEAEACRRADLIYDTTTAAVCSVTLVADTSTYAIHSKVTVLEKVIYDGEEIPQATEEELEAYYGATWRADTGAPTHYIVLGRNIRLYPIPTTTEAGETVSLEVYRLPLARFTDTLEVPEEYHQDLCEYVAYLAFKRRNEDTEDQRKAKNHLAEFTARFGELPDARVREHQLRSPKSLRFRPEYGYMSTGVINTDSLDEDCW